MKILEAWDEPTGNHPNGKHPANSLHYEGRYVKVFGFFAFINNITQIRAAQLTLSGDNAKSLHPDLSQLAICAGFHYIEHGPDSVNVYVALQKGFLPTFYATGETLLKSVWPPIREVARYSLPEPVTDEERQPELFDGRGKMRTAKLIGDIKVSDFVDPLAKYFRIDEQFLGYIDNLKQSFKSKLKIVKGYVDKPMNEMNKIKKHPEEYIRHQAGQAVELKLGSGSYDELLALGKKILKQLSNIVQLSGRKIGKFD